MENVHELWESVGEDEFLMFDRIPEADRPCNSPDICAFIYLDKKFPADRKMDMVSAAEHDQIWLRIDSDQQESLNKDDVLYLTRCGVFNEADCDALSMF